MNILIKLTCLIGLVIAPILGSGHGTEGAKASCHGTEASCAGKDAASCCKEGTKKCAAHAEGKCCKANAASCAGHEEKKACCHAKDSVTVIGMPAMETPAATATETH